MPQEGIMFDGCVKLALEDDTKKGVKKGDLLGKYTLPDTWHAVTEPTVIDKTDGSGEYVIMGVTQIIDHSPTCTEVKEDHFFRRSRLIVLDGDQLDGKPVYSLNLPRPLPYGLHSLYLEWDKLKKD
jgi:Retinal pigment epithelial membrane protein